VVGLEELAANCCGLGTGTVGKPRGRGTSSVPAVTRGLVMKQLTERVLVVVNFIVCEMEIAP
jgi:hypothetical protein